MYHHVQVQASLLWPGSDLVKAESASSGLRATKLDERHFPLNGHAMGIPKPAKAA
jgi:hypothetical protein